MPATPPDFFGNLDSTRPRGDESRTLSDDYQRNMRESCRIQGPNWTGSITATHLDLNKCTGLDAAGAKIMTGTGGTTIAPFSNAAAPIGWTIQTGAGFDGRMLVTAGTINGSTIAGGDTGGTNDPGINNTVPAHTHPDDINFVTENGGAHDQSAATGTGGLVAFGGSQRFNSSANIGSNNVESGFVGGAVTAAGDHTHPTTKSGGVQTNTSAADWVPLYRGTILCQLDA